MIINKNNPSEISLNWREATYQNFTVLSWRDILFSISHSFVSKKYYYSGREYTLTIDGKKYVYRCSDENSGMSRHTISKGNYSLTILMGFYSVLMNDNVIDPNIKPSEFIKLPFNIFLSNRYESKTSTINPLNITINKKEVTLYEPIGGNERINSFAYFDGNDLVIDYGILGGDYEDEYFITIKEKHLIYLFDAFLIESKNKAELLIGIMNAFKGKRCFNRVKEYLELKKIPFENSVRHG